MFIFESKCLLSEKLFSFFSVPRCFCKQWNNISMPAEEADTEIMCKQNGAIQPAGKCGKNEYCSGPHFSDLAECGKTKLCEPGR